VKKEDLESSASYGRETKERKKRFDSSAHLQAKRARKQQTAGEKRGGFFERSGKRKGRLLRISGNREKKRGKRAWTS